MTYDMAWLRDRFAGTWAQATEAIYCDPEEALPAAAKQHIADYLATCDTPEQFRAEFGRIIGFMIRGESTDGEETRQQIRRLDQRRQQMQLRTR